MNFRLILITTGLLTASALGAGCSRDELAPWGFPKEIGLNCADLPSGVVGRDYMLDLNTLVTGGVAPFTFKVSGLPPGLMVDEDTGIISGNPTMDGDFQIVVTVTDAAGETRTFDTCGNLTIERPDQADCIDETMTIPDGFVGIDYRWDVSFNGGPTPYTWEATGLPPGLTLEVDAADTKKATILGAPTQSGDYTVELIVTDAEGNATTTNCGALLVRDPVQVDHGELLAKVDGCLPVGDGTYDSIDDLFDQDILGGVPDFVPITCDLTPGRGNGSDDFDKNSDTPSTMPPGITLATDSCTVGGAVTSTLAYGIYGFIVTYTQSTSASTVNAYVPYCAANMTQAPTAYPIMREDTGNAATFVAGVQVLDPGEGVMYGTDVPDPKVTVTYPDPAGCAGSCFYAFVFRYNTLSGDASVSANPNAKFPAAGFEGFTHGIRFTDANADLLERFDGRAWVTNITFDYCMADNDVDCGNSEDDPDLRADLVRENGGGSNYYFSLVLLPAP